MRRLTTGAGGRARTDAARIVLGVALGGVLVACGVRARGAGADAGVAPSAAVGDTAPPMTPAPPAPFVRIVMTIIPNTKKAMVFWGRKRLGVIAPHAPLVVQRPRDSGPLDLVVRSDGYVTVQTRAYTFADSKLSVKLTPVDEKSTLLGYREELPPEDAGAPPASPDGGLPP